MNRSLPLALLTMLVTGPVRAGDLADLPSSDEGFRAKISAFIRPGGGLEEALSLLEAHRFVCREFSNKNPVIHCGRTDAQSAGRSRFYQVMIETSGGRIRTVEPSTGLIRE